MVLQDALDFVSLGIELPKINPTGVISANLTTVYKEGNVTCVGNLIMRKML